MSTTFTLQSHHGSSRSLQRYDSFLGAHILSTSYDRDREKANEWQGSSLEALSRTPVEYEIDDPLDGDACDEELQWDAVFTPLDCCRETPTPAASSAIAARMGYSYAPLKAGQDIRLLELELDEVCDNVSFVRCRLRTVTLDNPPPYLTLSYAWGPTNPDRSHLTDFAICNGYKIGITRTLSQALQRIKHLMYNGQLASADCSNRLWVDALCINQTDARERSQQVGLMSKIYHQSAHLIVWLGAAQISSLQHIDIARDLVHRSWFERRWIIQEFLFSHAVTFLYAQELFNYPEFLAAAPAGHCTPSIFQQATPTSHRKSLLLNLRAYAGSRCSDARDAIFALLSISTDSEHFSVDYTQSAASVHAAVAFKYIKEGHLVDVLHQAVAQNEEHTTPAKDQGSRWPSWVPDWSNPRTVDHTDHVSAYPNPLQGAWKDVLESMERTVDNCLRLRGWAVSQPFSDTSPTMSSVARASVRSRAFNASSIPAITIADKWLTQLAKRTPAGRSILLLPPCNQKHSALAVTLDTSRLTRVSHLNVSMISGEERNRFHQLGDPSRIPRSRLVKIVSAEIGLDLSAATERTVLYASWSRSCWHDEMRYTRTPEEGGWDWAHPNEPGRIFMSYCRLSTVDIQ